jgi:hypothetical protein
MGKWTEESLAKVWAYRALKMGWPDLPVEMDWFEAKGLFEVKDSSAGTELSVVEDLFEEKMPDKETV